MNTTPCKALKAFTRFVPGYGQVHGDPDNSEKAAQTPNVPNTMIDSLVEDGCVKAPKGWAEPESDAAPVDTPSADPAPVADPATDQAPA